MKHRKRRLNKGKVFLTLCLIGFLVYSICFIYQNINVVGDFIHIFFKDSSAFEYEIIKKDSNDNYLGKGQETIHNKDGYFTTFTTKDNKVYKEYKQNQGSWKNHEYWDDDMEESGCGITAMSIVLSGYGINNTPEDLRNKYYPVLNGENMSKELKSYGIDNTDFYFDDNHLSKESLSHHLKTNRPILICVWNKPHDNRWTTSSHYMVLLASDDNMVYVSNPNGGKDDSKSSGWYEYKEIQPYIAKAMYIENYE